MNQLAIQVEKLISRLNVVEDMISKNQSDYQPAVKLCKKYEISRSLRDRLVKEGVINEYTLFRKIYFKETEIIEALKADKNEKAAA